jgi:hypothetical protein
VPPPSDQHLEVPSEVSKTAEQFRERPHSNQLAPRMSKRLSHFSDAALQKKNVKPKSEIHSEHGRDSYQSSNICSSMGSHEIAMNNNENITSILDQIQSQVAGSIDNLMTI